MISAFQLVSIVLIAAFAVAGGYYPLVHRSTAREGEGLPLGRAFSGGVFLALAFIMMVPSSIHLFSKAHPTIGFPVPTALTILSFLTLLALAQVAAARGLEENPAETVSPASVPIIMTLMIAIPSFLLGTALGVSEKLPAYMILAAILAHKGSASFALALAMVRSTLTQRATYILFALFACTTPLGVFLGADVREHISSQTMTAVKAIVLALAAGVFLFMATLHELKHSPLIVDCRTRLGFLALLLGFGVTIMVALLLHFADRGHIG